MFSASFSLIRSKWGGSTIYKWHTQHVHVHWPVSESVSAKQQWSGGKNMGSLVYLGSVNRTGCEWSVREGLRGAQQVSDSIKVMFILLNRLNAHSVFGKKSFVTWCVTRRGQELKIPMATSQKEASSEKWRKTQVNKWEDIINVREWIIFLKIKLLILVFSVFICYSQVWWDVFGK